MSKLTPIPTREGPHLFATEGAVRQLGDGPDETRVASLVGAVHHEFRDTDQCVRVLPGPLVGYARRHEWSRSVVAVTLATLGEAPDPSWTRPFPPSESEIAVREAEKARERAHHEARSAAELRRRAVERVEEHAPEILFRLALAAGIVDEEGRVQS